MSDESPDFTPPPIPRDLFSEYEDRPFQHCTRCGETLNDFQGGFQISKAYKKSECVMEYALCDHCRTQMMEEFSQESKKRLAQFQDEEVNLERGMDACSVCAAPRSSESMEDFVITGICEGDHLLHSIMICGGCADGVQELISVKTRDTWRRFVNDNFPGPPPDGEVPEEDQTPVQIVVGGKI